MGALAKAPDWFLETADAHARHGRAVAVLVVVLGDDVRTDDDEVTDDRDQHGRDDRIVTRHAVVHQRATGGGQDRRDDGAATLVPQVGGQLLALLGTAATAQKDGQAGDQRDGQADTRVHEGQHRAVHFDVP